MSRNKKLFRLWMRIVAITIIWIVSYNVICSNYGEPPKVSYDQNYTER